MKPDLSWGIVGTGGIAADFAQALARSGRCRVVNVSGTSPEKARAFAQRFELPAHARSLEELLDDGRVQAVYIASPHPAHEQQALACIAAGKTVLCEKPLCVSAAGAERVIAAARSRPVFLMEAFMYRCHPLLREVLARLQGGAIGEIQHLRADFGFRVPRDPAGRLFNLGLGGGAILDVGGYPASLARLLAGVVQGTPFAEPVSIQASGRLGPTGADEVATALVRFASGFSAELTCAVHHDVGTSAVIFGERGKLVMPNPWIPRGDRQGLVTEFSLHCDGEAPRTVQIETEKPTYAIEAELVASSLPHTEPVWPAMRWDDTLGNLRLLDAWRAALNKEDP